MSKSVDNYSTDELWDKLSSLIGDFVGHAVGIAYSAWILMFAAAIIGFPIGYGAAFLVCYAVSCTIGMGTVHITQKLNKLDV